MKDINEKEYHEMTTSSSTDSSSSTASLPTDTASTVSTTGSSSNSTGNSMASCTRPLIILPVVLGFLLFVTFCIYLGYSGSTRNNPAPAKYPPAPTKETSAPVTTPVTPVTTPVTPIKRLKSANTNPVYAKNHSLPAGNQSAAGVNQSALPTRNRFESNSIYSKPPHIIFIVADDLGWNDIGWYNNDLHTPNLDRLAKEGVILNASYVQQVCSPSRNCFMTGYYPFHTGLQHGIIRARAPSFIPTRFTLLPERLKELGYTTHMVGKWHLGFCDWKYTPTERGFDSFMGHYLGQLDYFDRKLDNGYDFRFNKTVHHPPEGKYSTEVIADRAVEIINTLDPETQPLYLYLPFQNVHKPLVVPHRFERMYANVTTFRNRRVYCGMVSALDEAVGNITRALKDRGFMDNALIVFTTDNGGPTQTASSNLPLRGGKGSLWEGGTKGVGFVYSENLLHKTKYVNNELIHAVDWYPTLLSLAGGKPDREMDGVNQWETIRSGAPSARDEFVYNIDEINKHAAIRAGRYKLIEGTPTNPNAKKRVDNGRGRWYEHDRKWEELHELWAETEDYDGNSVFLFDLVDDPSETTNLADKLPNIVRKLRTKLDLHRQTMIPAHFPPDDANADPENFNWIWSPGWC